MATTKHRQSFYAEPEVEKYLRTIPAQLRSNWINEAIKQVIAGNAKEKSLEDRLTALEKAFKSLKSKA